MTMLGWLREGEAIVVLVANFVVFGYAIAAYRRAGLRALLFTMAACVVGVSLTMAGRFLRTHTLEREVRAEFYAVYYSGYIVFALLDTAGIIGILTALGRPAKEPPPEESVANGSSFSPP